jgi:nucleoside-diphosphate-sugar epimerase
MRVLITGASTPLALAAAPRLCRDHTLRLSDHLPVETDLEFVVADLGHDESTDALVADADVVIHCPHPTGDGDDAWIDAYTRQTYNLLTASLKAQVKQVILVSSLDLFTPYDEDMAVSETWRPLPGPEPRTLAPHLGEFVAREFAHDGALNVLCLRLGHLVSAAEATGQTYDPMWLEQSDAAEALSALLDHLQKSWDAPDHHRSSPWNVLHLQGAGPHARFGSERFGRLLDFKAGFDFEKNPEAKA